MGDEKVESKEKGEREGGMGGYYCFLKEQDHSV